MAHVTVIGGGIAGLCVAYYLRLGGATVSVLEARRVGSGASAGNAGWITPAQAGPLPEPGLVSYGLRSLVDADSALYFDPAQLVRMIPWLVTFARRCNRRDYERGCLALGRLGVRSFELLDGMRADGVEFELHRLPLLLATQAFSGAESFLSGLQPLARLGFRVPVVPVSGSELRALEPVLSDAVAAGFVIEEHRHVEAMELVSGLHRRLLELGVTVSEGVEVRDVEMDGSSVASLWTSAGRMRCESVVLSPGAWLGGLGKMVGLRLPVQAGKGYSFEVRPRAMPRHALLLLEPHVGCSPLGDRLRIAGTMEFSGIDARLNRRRLASIVAGAARMIDGWEPVDDGSIWCGLRPIAPDGLPIIDRHPRFSNVFVAGAYSMLGMTLAAPAGESLARFVLSGRRPAELEPFRCTRFGLGATLRRRSSRDG